MTIALPVCVFARVVVQSKPSVSVCPVVVDGEGECETSKFYSFSDRATGSGTLLGSRRRSRRMDNESISRFLVHEEVGKKTNQRSKEDWCTDRQKDGEKVWGAACWKSFLLPFEECFDRGDFQVKFSWKK